MNKEIVLAADLGGTNLRMAAIDRRGKILFQTKGETPRGENSEEIVRAIAEAAAVCRENCSDYKVKALLAAVPGTIRGGVTLKAPNLPALNDFQLAAALETELGIKVALENDANAAATGENWLGASKDFADSICITLGTGVGGGVIVDGKILRGADGAAGEIGHICVEPHGALCNCGARGCVEQYSSATAIVRLAKELKTRFPKSILDTDSPFTSLEVYRAGTEADKLALEVFRQMGFYLGVAVANLINVLNPHAVVIGGGAAAGWNLFVPHLKETLRERVYSETARKTPILPARLGDNAGIIGAARLAFGLPDLT
ncbi:MAG TPA: ROK family protein [Pyrinomonadaceae bacterium]|nr:ROK family protein [Pyrinomonadaceae bacterium]